MLGSKSQSLGDVLLTTAIHWLAWVSLTGCGAGEEQVAFAGIAGKGGGASELAAGFGVAA